MELLIYIAKSAGVVALFYAVYFLWLQRDTLFVAKRQFLLIGVISAVFLPLVEFTKTTMVEIREITEIAAVESIPLTHVIQKNEAIAIYWWQILLFIYTLGVLVLSVRFSTQLITLIKLISTGKSEKHGRTTHVIVQTKIAPFSFFNYVVYNPSLHTESELTMILKHEQIHTSQWHSLDMLLANVLVILQWLNPFAWLFKKSIEENLEFIADSRTARQVASKKAYQLALVQASSTFTVPALTNNFYQSFIKKRIIMLNKSTSKKVNVLKVGIILPLLAVFLWSFNVKEVVSYKTIPSEAIPSEVDATLDDANTSNRIESKKPKHDDTTSKLAEDLPLMVTPPSSEVEKKTKHPNTKTNCSGA